MKLSFPVFLVILVIALVVGGVASYAYLSPQISKEKDKVKDLQAELEELEELTETDATKINGHMQEMFKHAEEVEEELEENKLEGVAEDAEELAEYAEKTSKLTPPKGKDQISSFREMADNMIKDSKELEAAAKAGDVAKAKEAFEKVETGCVLCHPLFRHDNAEIHPEHAAEAASGGHKE